MAYEAIVEALADAGIAMGRRAGCRRRQGEGGQRGREPGLGDGRGQRGSRSSTCENACATAGSALRLCCQWVSAGFYDICVAVGMEKMARHFMTTISPEKDFDYWRWTLTGIPEPRVLGHRLQPVHGRGTG